MPRTLSKSLRWRMLRQLGHPWQLVRNYLRMRRECPDLETTYRSMIGSLLYLIASSPDLSFSIRASSKSKSVPCDMKRITQYVHGTTDLGIWFSKDSTKSMVGNIDDRKSTSGGCVYLGSNFVSWYSKKKTSISLSIVKPEYIVVESCCAQLFWMKQMIKNFGIKLNMNTNLFDNKNAINISKNLVQQSRSKHIDIRHHFIRQLIINDAVEIKLVSIKYQLANLFIKPLDTIKFEHLRTSIGVCRV
ncbi:Copia protein [Gossypium australe]|uniref:Copia protein n=1 Tax=Gossypium australe TaxID=47621 RepID=A0A5B6WGD5_9ROSI|nr:Copia protein [Gossypium australe]